MQGLMQGLRCASLQIVVRPLALEGSLSSSASSIVATIWPPMGTFEQQCIGPDTAASYAPIREPSLLCAPRRRDQPPHGRLQRRPPQLASPLTTRLRSVGGPATSCNPLGCAAGEMPAHFTPPEPVGHQIARQLASPDLALPDAAGHHLPTTPTCLKRNLPNNNRFEYQQFKGS